MKNRTCTKAATLAISVVAALGLVGCGSGRGSTPAKAQPAPHTGAFQPGNFDQLPRYPGSTAAGTRSVTGNTSVQSFTVTAASPQEVLQYYRDHLDPSWIAVAPPHQEGSTDWKGEWTAGNDRLDVTAAPAPTEGQQAPTDQQHVQYSLMLTTG